MGTVSKRITKNKPKAMRKIIESFTPKKQDIFSASSTALSIFMFMHFDVPMNFVFMIYVALFTIGMDFIYRACK